MTQVFIVIKEQDPYEQADTLYAGINLEEAFSIVLNEDEECRGECWIEVWNKTENDGRYYWNYENDKFMYYRKETDKRGLDQYILADDLTT